MDNPFLASPSQVNWNALATYVHGNVTIHQGGIWFCVARGPIVNSEPASGNADWMLVAGTPEVDVVIPPNLIANAPYFIKQVYNIASVNQSTKTFALATPNANGSPTDVSALAGYQMQVGGSTGNDGVYTIVSSTALTLTVAETIPDATGDGQISSPGIFGEGWGLIIVPAPGTNFVLSPIITDVQFTPSPGNNWPLASSPSLSYGLVTNAGTGTISGYGQSDGIDNGHTSQVVDVFPVGLSMAFIVNKPLVLYSEQDASNSGAGLGTRSLGVRFRYLTQPYPLAPATFFTITAVDQGLKQFTVSPDPTSAVQPGDTITGVGTTGNNKPFTVASRDATHIVVVQAIPSATADGWVKT